MASFQIGSDIKKTSWCSAEIRCDGSTGSECTSFPTAARIYHLYNVSGCEYISKSSLVIDIKGNKDDDWYHWVTYQMGGYEGFAYYWYEVTAVRAYIRATYKGITKYYTIGITEPDPEPEPEPEEPIMTDCITSPRINTGEIFVHHYADIGIEAINPTSVMASIRPLDRGTNYEILYLNTPFHTESDDYNITVTATSISTADVGSAIFKLCWAPKVAPPETCTQTFKLQDQNGNLLNGNVKVGTTNITVLGTGTWTCEKGRAYTAVASFSDQPTQSKTFTACTTTTFTFNVVPDVGTLSITTDPPGAAIDINFVSYGLTPRTNIELPLGDHTVTLKMEGYHNVTKIVTLQAGIPGIISVTLIPHTPPPEPEPEPEPDPEPGGYIGEISHEFSGDEIKIFVPVTNIWSKEICCYVDLRDQTGAFVDKAPMLLQTLKLLPGQSGIITLNSYGAINPSWDVNTIKGQTVSLELKGIATILGICSPPPVGYTIIHTKPYNVSEPEPEPEPEPGGYIGEISHEFSGDEIKIFVPVTNTGQKDACFYVDLRNQTGAFVDKAPAMLGTLKLKTGESGIITLNSYGAVYPSWNVTDIQGQTVTLELKGQALTVIGSCHIPSSGYVIVETKPYDVPMPSAPGDTKGYLKVTSEPLGCEIYIDDIYKGLTPTPFVLNVGTYTVSLKKEGYYPESEDVTIKEGETSYVELTLDPSFQPPDKCTGIVCENEYTDTGDMLVRECDPETGNCITTQTIKPGEDGYIDPKPDRDIILYIVAAVAIVAALSVRGR